MTMYQTHYDFAPRVLFSDENPDFMAQMMVHAPPKMFLKGYDQSILHVSRRDNFVFFGLALTSSGCRTRRKEITEFVTPSN